jgi:phage terminase small subunit
MPGLPLDNPRWEKFCQAYVQGESAGNAAGAYRAAGYSGATPRNALRLLNHPKIRARIAMLQRDIVHMEQCAMTTVTERLAMRRESVLGELASIGFARITDYVRQTPDGELAIDFAAIERDKAAGVVELRMIETVEGDRRKRDVRIKLGNKVGALAYLGKHLGLFVERIEENDDESLRHLTVDELKLRLAEFQRQHEERERRRGAGPDASPEDLGGAVPAPAEDPA